MEDRKIDKNALTEVYVILNQLELYSKIPMEFQKYIYENKNNNYDFVFNKEVPLFNQLSNDTTRILLSYIYIKYINDSSEKTKFLLNEVIDILKIREI